MQAGFVADKSLGYFQAAAGAVDAAVSLATLTGGSIPAGTSRVKISVGAQAIRWRDDGAVPTAAVGMPQAVGTVLDYQERDLSNLRFISQVAGAVLDIICYGSN